MPKTLTCHDALLLFKNFSFLAELRDYEVELDIFPAPILGMSGIFYVIIDKHHHFKDSAWIINVRKHTINKGDVQKILDEFDASQDIKNEIPRMIKYTRTIREKEIEDIRP